MGANTDIETSKGHKIVDNLDINLYIICTCIITSHHFRIARATSCHDKQFTNKHYGERDWGVLPAADL